MTGSAPDVPAKAWMSGDPVAVTPDASALEALECMTERGFRHLPVVDGERRVLGLITLDDLRAALPEPLATRPPTSPADRALAREWQVGELMTHAPETIRADGALAEAAERMAERKIGCLPVVDDAGRLVGMLSEIDLLHALATLLWTERVRVGREPGTELDRLVDALRRERDAVAELLAPRGGVRAAATGTLAVLAERRLAALEGALERKAQGRLGVCEYCGGAIPATRLRALPDATLCVRCAREGEGRA